MNTDKLLRVLIAAPQETPMPDGLGCWPQISAFTSIALSAAVIWAAVSALVEK